MPRAEQKSEQLQFPCKPKFSGASTSAVWAAALNLGFMNTSPQKCMRIIPFEQLGVNSKGDGPRCSFQAITRTKAALWTLWDHRAPASPGSQGHCPWPCQAGDAVKHSELISGSREPHTSTPCHPWRLPGCIHPPSSFSSTSVMHLKPAAPQNRISAATEDILEL